MQPDVAVMYGDLSIVRVPWDQKHTLPTTGVLFIELLNTERPLKRQRFQGQYENDFYVLSWTETHANLWGYDDNFWWHELEAQWAPDFKHRFPFELPADSIQFKGVQVEEVEWQKAKRLYNNRDGKMF